MEARLVKLKSDFNNIINIRNTVKNVFDILQIRIDKLRMFYQEFIQNNRNEMFVFGLDSFHFQSKLIDIEYDDMKRLFLAINNRMYCEYFKLNKIIIEYISKNINDKKILEITKINSYPIYKDLEPFKEYKFEIILDIHENILNLLGILISMLDNKVNELYIHKTKQNIGLNIDNFITSFNFNINVMREKITMFISYIEFFHKMHSKYLKRFSNKIQLMYTHINNDIKFDDSTEISKNKKKELLDEIIGNNIDSELLKDLKTSIGSETNSDASSECSKTLTNSSMPNTPKLDSTIMSIQSLSPINISSSAIANTISKSPYLNSDYKLKEKKGYKNLLKRNVHKVTDMLNFFKSKKDEVLNSELSNMEIDKMFNGIEESCDSIIFEKNDSRFALKPDNIGLRVDSFDTIIEEKSSEPVENSNSNDNNNEINKLNNENNETNIGLVIEDNTMVENEILTDRHEEELNEKDVEQEQEVQEQEIQEEVQEEIQEEVQEQEIQEEVHEELHEEVHELKQEPVKKKRTYNRKKK